MEFLNIWLSRRASLFKDDSLSSMASLSKKPPKKKPSKKKPPEQTTGERDGGKKRKRGDASAHLPPSRPSQLTKKPTKKHRTWTEVEKKMRDGLIQTAADFLVLQLTFSMKVRATFLEAEKPQRKLSRKLHLG